jgi:hypothetical protein
VSMPFGLKNTGATYQRCMLKCFGDLIGETVEAYVDDIVVKSKKSNHLMADLDNLQKTPREQHQTQSREMRFWGPEGYAT